MAEGGHTATRSGGPERSPTGGEIGGTGMAGAVDEAAPIAAPPCPKRFTQIKYNATA